MNQTLKTVLNYSRARGIVPSCSSFTSIRHRHYEAFNNIKSRSIVPGLFSQPTPIPVKERLNNLENADWLSSKLKILTLGQPIAEIGTPSNPHHLPIGIPNSKSPLIRYESPLPSISPSISEIPTGKVIDELSHLPKSQSIEIHAARLVVIRRIKMNKHKLRKLRKRMKYVWAKVKLRRQIRKEKIFLNEQMDKIREAQKFNAKAYVENILKEAKHVPEPTHWNFEWLPQELLKPKLAEKLKREEREYLSILDKRETIKKK